MSEIPTFSELEIRIRSQTLEKSKKLKFDASVYRDLVPVLQFLGLMETLWTACLIGKQGYKIQAYSLLRLALEQYIGLKLVCGSEADKWIDALLLNEGENWLKTLKRAKGGNPYFAKISELSSIDEIISDKEGQIADLKLRGAKRATIKEKFAALGQTEVYEGLYHKLSDEAHGSLQALKHRYFSVEGSELAVTAFHKTNEVDFDALRDTVSQLLDFSDTDISTRFNI